MSSPSAVSRTARPTRSTTRASRRTRPSTRPTGTGRPMARGAATPGAATGGARPLPLGTVAVVNGSIIAGGNALVRAKDDIKAQGIAGSFAAGAVGIGAAVMVMSVASHTEAQVSSTGSISSGTGSTE